MIWTLFIKFDSHFSHFFSRPFDWFWSDLRLHWIQNKTFQFSTTFSHRGRKMMIWYSDKIDFWHVILTWILTLIPAKYYLQFNGVPRSCALEFEKLSSPWKLAKSVIETFMLLISCCGSFIKRKLVSLLYYDEKLME